MESEVISIRVKRGTSTRLRKLGINSSSKARVYLEKLAWKAEAKKTIDELADLVKRTSKPSKAGFAVASIREDRDAAH
jgi:hypothetical protein